MAGTKGGMNSVQHVYSHFNSSREGVYEHIHLDDDIPDTPIEKFECAGCEEV